MDLEPFAARVSAAGVGHDLGDDEFAGPRSPDASPVDAGFIGVGTLLSGGHVAALTGVTGARFVGEGGGPVALRGGWGIAGDLIA